MELRLARQADAEPVAQLHAESWRQTYRGMMADEFLDGDVVSNRSQVWRRRLTSPTANQLVCVATEGEELLGFVCAYGADDPRWGSLIDNLHVATPWKRRGVGQALMREASHWLCTHYARLGVYLWVMEENHAARRFYERLAAAHAGTEDKTDPAGGTAPNCRYAWERPELLAQAL